VLATQLSTAPASTPLTTATSHPYMSWGTLWVSDVCATVVLRLMHEPCSAAFLKVVLEQR